MSTPKKQKRTVYLDHNATTPVTPAARAAMLAAMEFPGNASAVHRLGRDARRLIEQARETVAAACGLGARDVVIFTSGATEANNLALLGAGVERLIVSSIEHPSVLGAAARSGLALDLIPVTGDGVIDLSALEALLRGNTRQTLISVMMVNNETGVIQPVSEVTALARRYGALVHCDAVQAIGRLPFSVSALGVDFASISAHKIGGPQGAGALLAANCVEISPLFHGGGQEKGRRAGTENLPGIAGLAAAIGAPATETMQQQHAAWRDRIEAALIETAPALRLPGQKAARVANTTMVSLPGVPAESQLIALDLAGICLSNGSACSSGTVKPSHVLKAMGLDDATAAGALRVSLGWTTTEEDIEDFIAAWRSMYERVKDRCQN